VRVIARQTLTAFACAHPSSRPGLGHWYRIAKAAEWYTMADVQAAFSKAKILNAERARFSVQGGNYRLIAAFNFPRQIAFIKFVGTHADYDKIDALTVSQY